MAGVLEKEKRKYAVGPGETIRQTRKRVKRTMWIILSIILLCAVLIVANAVARGEINFTPAKAWFVYE